MTERCRGGGHAPAIIEPNLRMARAPAGAVRRSASTPRAMLRASGAAGGRLRRADPDSTVFARDWTIAANQRRVGDQPGGTFRPGAADSGDIGNAGNPQIN